MNVASYKPYDAAIWNQFVRQSRNGTFLFERPFMDYHQDRFTDASLLFYDDKNQLKGILPANIRPEKGLIQSHGGLTYGGLLLDGTAQVSEVGEMMQLLANYYISKGCHTLQYKPTPYIYHTYPAEEDLYWLFRANATLQSRAISSAIRLNSPIHQQLWHRKIKHKATEGLVLSEDRFDRLPEFWNIVSHVLQTRHQARPVHTADEINLLHSRFPDRVKLFTVTNENDEVITGAVLFITSRVAHVQYMEAGEEARQRRALDWLIKQLIARYEQSEQTYFEFGISTENNGRLLNEGLAYQKEGFGGRGVCYDTYLLDLASLLER